MTSLTPCSIDGCVDYARTRGWCQSHYARFHRYGDPLAGAPTRRRAPKGLCSMDECGKPVRSIGLCDMHYWRNRKYGSPNSLKNAARQYDGQGRKLCATCQQWLDPSLFKGNSHMADGLLSQCKRCYRDRAHHLTVDRRDLLLKRQGNQCGIAACGRAIELYGPNTYHVDHDHTCCAGVHSCGECIRGLLCPSCNAALGYVGDNTDVLASMIEYLEKPTPL